jgi:DNA-binding CsgD family transcriptional regulator
LIEYFDAGAATRDRVPDALRRWLSAHRLRATRGDRLPAPRAPLVLYRNGRRLTIRILAETASGQTLALDERPLQLEGASLQPLGLTQRESEILLWVARGKTNPEIGMILGLSSRTVHKHLEHIFAKLGVETRTAAAARAWELVTCQTLESESNDAVGGV